jgi:beta-galactosidase
MFLFRSIISIISLVLFLPVEAQTIAPNQTLFDFDWMFSRVGKTVNVNLPHDWDIYETPDPATGATGTGGGWYQGGKGEYRKTFKTPAADIVKLHFEGVYQKAEVFVNGQKAGQHAYGYTPFTVDITPFLKQPTKQDNEVVVKVDNSEQPNCRWYSGSGIYRHVWLLTMPAVHLVENGVYLTTPEVSAQKATVKVEVTVRNDAATVQQARVGVEGQQQTLTLQPGEEQTALFNYDIASPRLWSPDNPFRYVAKVDVNGFTAANVPFGVRFFSSDAEHGFLLNGKPMLLNGACLHHDDGVLGAMAFDAAEVRKVRLMKEAGFNLIRTSHNPSSRAFIEACDSIGMLVIDEAFDGWRKQKNPFDYSTLIDSCYREDIRALVCRDRNSPSVIAWSIGNEVMERSEIGVVKTAKQLKKAVLEFDSTRPVTEALCSWGEDWESFDPHAEVLDIVGYNYMIHMHGADHQRDPKRVMWQTESYPRDAFSNWALTNDYPYIIGDIVWTGLDYLGESGIGRFYYKGKDRPGEHYASGGQPDWHGAYCGDVDMTGWRKPISHYREMLWSSGEYLYMAVKEPSGYQGDIALTAWSVWPEWESWNWQGWEGKPIEVEVFTRSPQVSLYLNGELVGTKQVDRSTQFKAVFSVPYQPGTLIAKAGGKEVSLTTAGEPAAIRLTADKTILNADGQDLAFITLEVVDRKGNVCPEAEVDCQAALDGKGTLLAAASADLRDREPYTSPRVKTWKGRAIIVVRSTSLPGKSTLTVTAPTLSKGKIELKIK